MKLNKLSLLAVVALGGLTAFGPPVQAQDATNTPPAGQHQRPPGGDRLARLATELGLSADQKEKLGPILKDQAEQMRALAPEDRKTKGKEIRDATNEKVKAILTPEQFTKFQELTKHRHGPGGPGAGGPPPAPAPTN